MARPTDGPLFATDTNFAADGDPWSSTPTRVDPGASRTAEGYEPGNLLPAQWLNHRLGVQGDWASYFSTVIDADDEHTYPVAKTATRYLVPGCDLKPGISELDGAGIYIPADPDNSWHPGILPVGSRFTAAGGPGGRDLLIPTTHSICSSPYNEGILPVQEVLANGFVLTQVEFYVTPNNTSATADDRMQVSVGYWGLVGSTIVTLATSPVDNVSTLHVVTLTGLTFEGDREYRIPVLLVRASKDAASTPNMFLGAGLRYTYQGPRAY